MSREPGRNQPALSLSAGKVRCAVWENAHPENGVWYSVTLTRAYQDQGGAWRAAHSFGRDDLLAVAELARQAWAWVAARQGRDGDGGGGGVAP